MTPTSSNLRLLPKNADKVVDHTVTSPTMLWVRRSFGSDGE